MDDWVKKQYYNRFCDKNRVQKGPVSWLKIRNRLCKVRPGEAQAISEALERFSFENCQALCDTLPLRQDGGFQDYSAALSHLMKMRIGMKENVAKQMLARIEKRNIQNSPAPSKNSSSVNNPQVTKLSKLSTKIQPPINPVRRSQRLAKAASTPSLGLSQQTSSPAHVQEVQVPEKVPPLQIVEVSLQLEKLQPSDESRIRSDIGCESDLSSSVSCDDQAEDVIEVETHGRIKSKGWKFDFRSMDALMAHQYGSDDSGHIVGNLNHNIKHAPLVSGNIVIQHARNLVPQYGFLGCIMGGDHRSLEAKVFQNTNVPFSAFVCGIQGSGKSHTTACMLENALIPSKELGCLEAPASALVFSYGKWSSGIAGFSISEATYLTASKSGFPGHHVKKVTVLISPSNPGVREQYERLPNVEVIPFRLNPKTLDIVALRTLMGVDDKTVPLYMAKLECIVRDIACNSKDGCLNYRVFKKKLSQEKFDATQTNMLEMRLNLLESFLALEGNAEEPAYGSGELTIIDLTDPFVTPHTACILFKLGLDRFLQSSVKSKMVVLDEAHKFMLNTPGSKLLTDRLDETIRLQRHEGARVIISTQEPTVSTDLIALCSVTIIHRFTSPTWYNALKRHINAMEDDQAIKRQIEGLETGEALVYAPNAVLGKNSDGSLIKAPGRLLQMRIRKRVTRDGGKSIMAI